MVNSPFTITVYTFYSPGSDMIILVAMIARWEVGRDILMKGLMDDTWAGHQVGIKLLHLVIARPCFQIAIFCITCITFAYFVLISCHSGGVVLSFSLFISPPWNASVWLGLHLSELVAH